MSINKWSRGVWLKRRRNFCCEEKHFFAKRRLFLERENFFCKEKTFFAKRRLFLQREDFFEKKIFFLWEKFPLQALFVCKTSLKHFLSHMRPKQTARVVAEHNFKADPDFTCVEEDEKKNTHRRGAPPTRPYTPCLKALYPMLILILPSSRCGSRPHWLRINITGFRYKRGTAAPAEEGPGDAVLKYNYTHHI